MRLDIQGLAIIDQLSVEFHKGFNIITGETGSGKSILVKALLLLCGHKSSVSIIRHEKNEAKVCGFFHVPPEHPVWKTLQETGVIAESTDSTLILRRVLNNKGRSFAWINDTGVTLKLLKKIAGLLVDIFAQHSQHELLTEALHTKYLDTFVKEAPHVEYQKAYRQYLHQYKEFKEFLSRYQNGTYNRDYLEFRKQALDAFAPSIEDYETVKKELGQLENKIQRHELLHRLQKFVDRGSGSGDTLRDVLVRLSTPLRSSKDSELKKLVPTIDDICNGFDTLSYEIGRLSDAGGDEALQALNQLQERLANYQEFCRKLGVGDVEELMDKYQELIESLDFLNTYALELEKYVGLLYESALILEQAGIALSQARQKEIDPLTKKLEAHLSQLGMPKAQVAIELVANHIHHEKKAEESLPLTKDIAELWESSEKIMGQHTLTGRETARFLLAANPGEPLRPLAEVASGGEISRMMLAFKKVFAKVSHVGLLVFDELDQGLSGQIAHKLGLVIKDLSTDVQIICISHLAQVAAQGEEHFCLHKKNLEGSTTVSIKPLNMKHRRHEIARLLSGHEVNSSSLANADFLLG